MPQAGGANAVVASVGGGSGAVSSVSGDGSTTSVNQSTGAVVVSVKADTFDAYGAAAAAQAAAIAASDPIGSAAAAQAAAEAASDPVGSAATAQSNAEAYALAQKFTPSGSWGFLGDSIFGLTYDQPGRPSTSNVGIGTWASALSQRTLTIAYNDGIPGSGCTDTTWTQRTTNAIATGLQNFAVLIGTNDVGNGKSAASIISAITTTVTSMRNAGIFVALCTMMPRGTISVAEAAVMLQVNSWIREQEQLGAVVVVDFAAALTDPNLGYQLNTALSTTLCPSTQWKGSIVGSPTANVTISETGTGTITIGTLSQTLPVGSWINLVQVISGTLTVQTFVTTSLAVAGTNVSVNVTSNYYNVGSGPTFTTAAQITTTYSTDDIHMSPAGAALGGLALIQALDPYLPQAAPILPQGDVGGGNGWNLLEQTVTSYKTASGYLTAGTFPTSFASGEWYWATTPTGGAPEVNFTAATDLPGGYWATFTVPTGTTTCILRGYATASGAIVQNIPTLYGGQVLIGGIEISVTNVESPASVPNAGVFINVTGTSMSSALTQSDMATNLAGVQVSPNTFFILQTPQYLGTQLSFLSSTLAHGNSYTSLPLSVEVTRAIPANTSLLVQDQSGNGQFVTTSGVTPVGATSIAISPALVVSPASGYPSGVAAVYATYVRPAPIIPVSSYAITTPGAGGTAAGTWTGTPPAVGTALTGANVTGTLTVAAVAGTEEAGTFTTSGSGSATNGAVTPAAVTNGNRYLKLTIQGGCTVSLRRAWLRLMQASL